MRADLAAALSEAGLHELRTKGDPETDKLIADLYKDRQIDELNTLLLKLRDNRQLSNVAALEATIRAAVPPGRTQDELVSWVQKQAQIPGDLDKEKLAVATRLYQEHGAVMALVLATASLVCSYAAPVGALTLNTSYRLNFDARRRIGETAQFVIANLEPRGFEPDGMALPTILKVRLMHAAIRFLIGKFAQEKSGMSWGEFVYQAGLSQQMDEVPIPREDQLGALMSFSFKVLDGFERLGVEFDESEKEALIYHWRIVGLKLGIPEELLPNDLAEAEAITNAVWNDRTVLGNANGRLLTLALLKVYQNESADWLDGVVTAVVRRAIPTDVADGMGVPRDLLWDTVLDPPWVLGGLIRIAAFLSRGMFGDPVRMAARVFLTRPFQLGEPEPAKFTIPETLQDHWSQHGQLDVRDGHLRALAVVHRAPGAIRRAPGDLRNRVLRRPTQGSETSAH
jgi:hypothetical protein